MNEPLKTSYLPGRTLRTTEKELLYFSGTSYLGIPGNQEFREFLLEGLARYGSNYSSSRLSNVHLQIFDEAEAYLANYTGAEAALTVSSGFLAGQLVVRTLAGKGAFMYGPRTHPALWLNPTNFNNVATEEWLQQLPDIIENCNEDNLFVLFNAVDALWAKKFDLDWINKLPLNKQITLIIDDSHGFGITGKNGAGVFTEILLPENLNLIVVSSIGKALGIPGGVILGKAETVNSFKQSPLFGGGSPVVPAYLYAFLQANQLYEQAREKLFRNINYFLTRLTNPEFFRFFPDYPVFYTPQNELCPFLFDKDILISSFAYPTPQDPNITRIILNSLHTLPDIDLLASNINEFCRSYTT